MRFGYYNFAFLGPESEDAAAASECADEQGKFWEYHDKLFASQAGENKGAFARDKLKQFAADLQLNTTRFNQCLDSGKYATLVQQDTQTANQWGVQSTPAFLVNSQTLSGAQPFTTFQQLIESEKNKK